MKKLNLGCGGNILPDWENHDSDMDVSKPLPFPDNSIDHILAEHIGEHLTHIDALAFFEECYRVLKPEGGCLRVCVPTLEYLDREHAKDIVRGHGHKAAYSAQLLKDMIRIAGFDPENIYFTSREKIDGHWKVIGLEKDDIETTRINAFK